MTDKILIERAVVQVIADFDGYDPKNGEFTTEPIPERIVTASRAARAAIAADDQPQEPVDRTPMMDKKIDSLIYTTHFTFDRLGNLISEQRYPYCLMDLVRCAIAVLIFVAVVTCGVWGWL